MRKTMESLVRVFALIIGIVGIVWFFIPFVTHKILNIGNITGIVTAFLFLLYGIFAKAIHQQVHLLWKSLFGKIIVSGIGIVVVVTLSLVIFITYTMVKAANTAPEKNATAIILGCRVYGERPSLMLVERLEAGYEYLSKNPSAICILSGGEGAGENISEGEAMYRYLTKKGISSERLIIEGKSTSTEENLLYSKEIIEENQLSKKVVVITNEFHQYRGIYFAEKAGLEAGAKSAGTVWWLFPTFYVRELYGILFQWCRSF